MSFSHVVTLVFLDDPGRQPLRMCTFHFIVKEIEILPAIPKLASGQLKTGSHVSWVVVHHGSGKTWDVEWQAWVRKDPTNWLFVPNLLTTSNFLRSFYPFYPRSCVLKNGQLASWQFFCIIRPRMLWKVGSLHILQGRSELSSLSGKGMPGDY